MTISSLNYTSQTRGILTLTEFENTTFSIQHYRLPGLKLPKVEQPTPLLMYPVYGHRLEYEGLIVKFQVNEDLGNWLELHNWITGLGAPEDKDQFKNRQYTSIDANLSILSNQNAILKRFEFVDCVPTYLSGIEFTETQTETIPSHATLHMDFAIMKVS